MGYGPFGFVQYHAGQTGTNKGYTGQDTDPLSGLDYYVARYYDPVVGLFLSVDTVQSNLQGFDPYAYVGNNPETLTDPSGHDFWSGIESGSSQLDQAVNDIYTTAEQAWSNWVPDPEAEVAASITTAAIIELVAPIVVPALLVVTLLSIPSDSPLPSASSQNQQPASPQPSKPTVNNHPSPTPATNTNGAGARCGSNCTITREYIGSYHQPNSQGGASSGKSTMDLTGAEAQRVLNSAIPTTANSLQLVSYYNQALYIFKFTRQYQEANGNIVRQYHGFKVNPSDLNTELRRMSKATITTLVNQFGAPKQWLKGKYTYK